MSDEEKHYVDKVPYSNVVSSVMYSMVCTMIDLAHGISTLSRYMSNQGRSTGQL